MVASKDKVAGVPESSDLTAQLRQMQRKMREAQAELAEDTLTVKGDRESVIVVISGAQQLRSVRLKPELLQAGDPEVVSDILVTVINDAIVQSQALAARRLKTITGGLGLPGP